MFQPILLLKKCCYKFWGLALEKVKSVLGRKLLSGVKSKKSRDKEIKK